PVCNAADYTRGCLDELRARGEGVLEVIVVDNGSTDATAQVLAEHPEARVLRNAANLRFAAAVNQGVAAARGELVCVLNNDTLLAQGWLTPMIATLRDEPRVALVGPCTSYAKGRQQIVLTPEGRPFASVEEMRELAAQWCARERGRREDAS